MLGLSLLGTPGHKEERAGLRGRAWSRELSGASGAELRGTEFPGEMSQCMPVP